MAPTRTTVWRWVAMGIGLALTLAAVTLALRGADLAAIRHAPPWAVIGCGIAVGINLVLTGILFWSVTRSFDASPPVPVGRMVELVAASSLLNYLPLRAGLFGRAAWLKAHHALPWRQSVLILGVVLGLGVFVLGLTGVAVAGAPASHREWACLAAIIALLCMTPVVGPVTRLILRRPIVGAEAWIPLRVADMLVGGGRLWLAFQIVGQSVTFTDALALSAAGMVVAMIGLTPNGLGLREWTIAGLSALLATADPASAAAAALADRAIEAVVVTALGLPAIRRLSRDSG